MVSIRSYEVQLESKVRRKGLGKFLIQILQLIANRCGCECVWFIYCPLNSKAVFFSCSCHSERLSSPHCLNFSHLDKIAPTVALALPTASPRGREGALLFAFSSDQTAKLKFLFCFLQHTDEEGDVDGLQTQPRGLPVLQRSATVSIPPLKGSRRKNQGAKQNCCSVRLTTPPPPICSSSVHPRFEIDETSPSMSGCCGDDCSYEILSRRTKHGEASAGHTHGGGHCGGCCH